MAQIKMDVSEYEEMKKNAKLLEKSLEIETKLREEISKLNKEKIEALEEAKMKVVKITKNQTTQHMMVKRSGARIWHNIITVLMPQYQQHRNSVPTRNFDEHMVEYGLDSSTLIDAFFEKATSFGFDEPFEITTEGLDDVKKEIRESIKAEIDADIKERLDQAEVQAEKFDRIMNENKILSKELSSMTRYSNKIHDSLSESVESNTHLREVIKQNDKFRKAIGRIASILVTDYGIFSRAERIARIKQAVDNAYEANEKVQV